jgi:hypothetical protein
VIVLRTAMPIAVPAAFSALRGGVRPGPAIRRRHDLDPTVLHRFAGQQAGAFPNNVVLGRDGALYGPTTGGGGNPSICSRHIGCGMVFRLTL